MSEEEEDCSTQDGGKNEHHETANGNDSKKPGKGNLLGERGKREEVEAGKSMRKLTIKKSCASPCFPMLPQLGR